MPSLRAPLGFSPNGLAISPCTGQRKPSPERDGGALAAARRAASSSLGVITGLAATGGWASSASSATVITDGAVGDGRGRGSAIAGAPGAVGSGTTRGAATPRLAVGMEST